MKRNKATPKSRRFKSLHVRPPIEGPRGLLHVLYWDEVKWAIKYHEVVMEAAPEPEQSKFAIKPQAAPQRQVMRIPVWELAIPDGDSRVVIITVPLDSAYQRQPMELVGEGEDRQLVPASVAFDRREAEAKLEAQRANGGRSVSESGLITPGTETAQ